MHINMLRGWMGKRRKSADLYLIMGNVMEKKILMYDFIGCLL